MTFPAWSVACLLVCLAVAVPCAAAKSAVNCETTELEAELVSCAKDELKRTESALDGMMRRVMRTVPASIHEALQNAQSAWNRYREAECAWNALDPETGKADDLMRLTCLNDLALTRIDELDASLGGN
ncbi:MULTISPECIES: lysozyme inhibitor LprI family protein [unclassified Haematospirillum]|uniref:lysozyme inhibitor LprI family protein n=1 Tax=unclassified Haematospirillum TaxID=2622088 RepID=UPI00143C555A|nr:MULTISPECIES: lysozyme inhibitor LprI family protein [unclassified Haematospirillum]NKD54205.1 DUF1311 domain-containing protein [Haematospirillum sp. H4890]NKD74250.1 DUF1311 domain-containing protein [Haematospirillum sp. H4485]NKD87081.1 DUF1311 domain-containing protein [Haematospirillum sp. 15-248]